MVRGKSGRVVLEIDSQTKVRLYEALDKEGLTLKKWFAVQTAKYLQSRTQPELFDSSHKARPDQPVCEAPKQEHVKVKEEIKV